MKKPMKVAQSAGNKPMTDKPKEWPYKAKEARDQAAEEAMAGIRALTAIIDSDMPEVEKVRRVARALVALNRIAMLLLEQGAQIDP